MAAVVTVIASGTLISKSKKPDWQVAYDACREGTVFMQRDGNYVKSLFMPDHDLPNCPPMQAMGLKHLGAGQATVSDRDFVRWFNEYSETKQLPLQSHWRA